MNTSIDEIMGLKALKELQLNARATVPLAMQESLLVKAARSHLAETSLSHLQSSLKTLLPLRDLKLRY